MGNFRKVKGVNHIVYFSSVTNYTHRFVEKLGIPATRIPIREQDGDMPVMDRDYILICPTYGGGVGMTGENSRPVPPQVRKFLMKENNYRRMMAVVATGNINFGTDYCIAGDVISRKFNVPYIYRLELMGTDEDVITLREKMKNITLHVPC